MGEKLGIQGCVASARWRVSQRAPRPRGPGRARPLAPRPRPATGTGGGQHQVGIEALQRVDPVGRRHLFQRLGQRAHIGRLALRQRRDQLAQPWGQAASPLCAGAGPPAARRRPPAIRGRVRRSARAAIAARCRHRAPAGRRRQRDTRVGNSRSGASATSRNTVCGGGSSSTLSSALAETTFSAWAGYSSAARQPPRWWRC